jgi:hypothetical protein
MYVCKVKNTILAIKITKNFKNINKLTIFLQLLDNIFSPIVDNHLCQVQSSSFIGNIPVLSLNENDKT